MNRVLAGILAALLLVAGCGMTTGATGTANHVGNAAAGNVAAGEKTYLLKLGTLNPGNHPYNLGARKFADEVKRLTDGHVQIQLYPDSQLGNARDEIEGLQTGTQDFHVSSIAPLEGFVPLTGVVQLPYIFRSPAQAYLVANGEIGQQLSRAAEKKGIKIVAYFTNGFRSFTNNVRPITKPQDVAGLKIRVQKSSVYVDMIKVLGGTAVPLAYSELYTALQQHTVDGQENPPVNVWVKKFYEVQKYYALDEHTFDLVPVLMSMATWNTLPPAYQQALMQAAKTAADYEWKIDLEQQNEDLAKLRSKLQVDNVDREAFVQVMKEKMWPKYAKEYGQALIDQIHDYPVDMAKIPNDLQGMLQGK